jgi:hypothetical protein
LGGGVQAFGAEDVGDAFDHQVFAEIAVSEKAAGIAVDFEQRRQDSARPRDKRGPQPPERAREPRR